MKKFKRVLIAALGALTAFTASVPMFVAAEEIPTDTVGTIQGENTHTFSESMTNLDSSANILEGSEYQFVTSITTEEMSNRIVNKANEWANTFRRICIPIVVILFAASTIVLIVGALSSRKTILPGVLGMLLSGLAFAAIVYAPQWLSVLGTLWW